MVDPVGSVSGVSPFVSAHLLERSVPPLGRILSSGWTSGLRPLLVNCSGTGSSALESTVCFASGPPGLALIVLYSFLIAFVLPLPSEIVLAPVMTTGTLQLGLPYGLSLALVIIVSGAGKALGSLFAFHIGQEAKESGPIIRLLRRSPVDIVEWSERKTVQLARRYGYFGLALALCVPGFPDTLSIYAFSVLEENYLKFAAATFTGSAGRLVLTVTVWESVVVLF